MGNLQRLAARVGLGIVFAAIVSATAGPVWADPLTGEIFYTRFSGAPNVKKVSVSFDGGSTFTLGTPVAVGTTFGADGIAGNPQNADLLLVAGQGPRINSISRSTGVATFVSSPVNAFHLEISDPFTVYAAGIPGSLARHTISPSGVLDTGTLIGLAGPDTVITQLITTPAGFFYTSSGPGGFGTYGTLTFTSGTTATTTRLHGPGGSVSSAFVGAAHGGTYDPFTNTVIIVGDGQVVQLDLAGGILSSRLISGVNLDQGTVDGNGHLIAASNTGHLLFLDYSTTGLIGDPSNFTAVPFLDTNLDDVAPLVGPGTTDPGPSPVPEPSTLMLAIFGAVTAMGHRRRQRRAHRRTEPCSELSLSV